MTHLLAMLLNEAQFLETTSTPMAQVSPDGPPPLDFWPYFEKISTADFAGKDCSAGVVEWIWNDSRGRFQHVLINSTEHDVFMVIILDLREKSIIGHRLLDLPTEYGLR